MRVSNLYRSEEVGNLTMSSDKVRIGVHSRSDALLHHDLKDKLAQKDLTMSRCLLQLQGNSRCAEELGNRA